MVLIWSIKCHLVHFTIFGAHYVMCSIVIWVWYLTRFYFTGNPAILFIHGEFVYNVESKVSGLCNYRLFRACHVSPHVLCAFLRSDIFVLLAYCNGFLIDSVSRCRAVSDIVCVWRSSSPCLTPSFSMWCLSPPCLTTTTPGIRPVAKCCESVHVIGRWDGG